MNKHRQDPNDTSSDTTDAGNTQQAPTGDSADPSTLDQTSKQTNLTGDSVSAPVIINREI